MEQHVGFSPNGKLFALISDQGILRIWDTETSELKQEYTPNLHLSGPCTALIWVSVAESQTEKKRNKAKKSAETKLCIALGTSKGGITLYSVDEGKIVRSLKGEGHSGRVTAIARADDVLYTCGDDCQIISWSLSTQERLDAWFVGPEKPLRIAYLSNSEKILVGSRQIKVYSAQSHELLQTYTGHSSDINFLTTVKLTEEKDSEYCVSSSTMERIICFWKLSKTSLNSQAHCTLLMEDIAYQVACQIDNEQDVLRVAGVTRSGVVHIYLLDIKKLQSNKPYKPKVTIEIATDDTKIVEQVPIVAVSLIHSNTPETILIGYGDKRVLAFEQTTPVYTQKKQILVRQNLKKIMEKFTANKNKNVENSNTNANLKTIEPIVDPAAVEYKPAASLPRKKLKPTEIPMEARIQNLNLGDNKSVGAQGKTQLLVQALHSKDAILLRSVLQTNDAKTIELTLQRLPVQYVSHLVNELTLLMRMKSLNIQVAIKWLKSLVQTHSSQLIALGANELMEKFGPCIGIIEYRSGCLKELSKLNGRLSLVVNQIKRNTEDALNIDDVVVFEDKDEDSSDIELSNDKTPSDGEWDEANASEDEEMASDYSKDEESE